MFGKLLFIFIATAAIGAALLGLRQQRLTMMHEMAVLHQQMDATRKQTWSLQERIAQETRPQALREAMDRIGLQLEPVTPKHIVDPAAPGTLRTPVAQAPNTLPHEP